MAEAFVRSFTRDYVRVVDCPDDRTVLRSPPGWFTHYNDVRPIALGDTGTQAGHPYHPDNLAGSDVATQPSSVSSQ
ncbi:hypothetical protein WDZ92_42820 [Nostoc sp. NIES-2111]